MEKQVLFWSRAKLAKDNGKATESARLAGNNEYPDDVVEGDEKLGIFEEVSVSWSVVTSEESLGLYPRYS